MKSLLVVCAMAVASSASFGQIPPPKAPEAEPAPKLETGPRAALDIRKIDFGDVIDDQIVTREVTIYNRGDAPLEVQDIRGSCTCVGGKAAQNVVPAGGQETVVVYFNPNKRRGLNDKMVRIRTNDPVAPNQVIQVKAVAKPRLWLDPSTVTFDQIAADEVATRVIKITSRKKDFEIEKVQIMDGDVETLRWTFGERRFVRFDGEDLATIDMRLTLDPQGRTGRLRGLIHLQTNDENRPMAKLRIAGEVTGDILLDTKVFAFKKVRSGVPKTVSSVISTRNGEAFGIKTAKAIGRDAGMVDVTVTPINGTGDKASSWRVDATLTAEVESRNILRGEILLTTDHRGESVRVQFSAIADP